MPRDQIIDSRYESVLSFIDMETRATDRPGTGIRLFDVVLRLLIAALALASLASLVLVGLFLTERGPIALPVRLGPPFALQLLDDAGREIEVSDAGTIVRRTNFEIGEEARYIKTAPSVVFNARVDRDDTDTRIAVSAVVLALLALSWIVVVNLEAIVGSARRGDPFAPRNVARLRRIAWSLVTVPLIGAAGVTTTRYTLDVDPPAEVLSPGSAWLAFVIVALGVFALAEVFKEGASLRQFEHETI